MLLAEQELFILREHLSLPAVFSGIHIAQSLIFCISFCRSLFVLYILLLLVIVLSAILRFTDSDYCFDIFKPFLCEQQHLAANTLHRHYKSRFHSRCNAWRYTDPFYHLWWLVVIFVFGCMCVCVHRIIFI